MPWQCSKCSVEVKEDDLECPKCSSPKTTWTLIQDSTRTFTVSSRRIQYLIGRGSAAAAGFADPYGDVEWREARWAPVTDKGLARLLAEEDLYPPPRSVLNVRLQPGKAKDRTVTLTVEYEADDVEEHELEEDEQEEPGEGVYDARFFLVAGDGVPPDPDAFIGLRILDVTELDVPAGFAPWVELQGLRKPPKRLPTRPADGGVLWLKLYDAGTGEPLAGRACSPADVEELPIGEAETDDGGVVRFEEVPRGDYTLRVEGVDDPCAALVLPDDAEEPQVRILGEAPRHYLGGGGEPEEDESLGRLHLRLFDAAGGESLGGRVYRVEGGGRVFEGALDAEGSLRHDDVAAGDYTLTLEGFDQPVAALVLPPWDPDPQVRFLGDAPREEPGGLEGDDSAAEEGVGKLHLVLYDLAGGSFAGRSYRLEAAGAPPLEGVLEGEGSLLHEGVGPGDYSLTVEGLDDPLAALVLPGDDPEPQVRIVGRGRRSEEA